MTNGKLMVKREAAGWFRKSAIRPRTYDKDTLNTIEFKSGSVVYIDLIRYGADFDRNSFGYGQFHDSRMLWNGKSVSYPGSVEENGIHHILVSISPFPVGFSGMEEEV